MTARQESDGLAWDRSDELYEEAKKQVRFSSVCRKIESFAGKVFEKPVTFVPPLIIGGFNVLYPVRVEAVAANALVRLPLPN